MVEWNRETPWRQGLLLTREACEALQLAHFDGQEVTVVAIVSHDCDLTQHPSVEQYVEVVVGRSVNNLDGNYTYAKNSRKLHIDFLGETKLLVEFDARYKTFVSKEALNKFYPHEQNRLGPEGDSVYQYWLASRYHRSAFPDEFESRLKDANLAKKIAKILTPLGKNISGIFFDVDEGVEVKRNGPEDVYKLDIYLLHATEPDFIAAEAVAQQAAIDIKSAFKDKLFTPAQAWRQIELSSCEVLSEASLSYQHFRQLKRWRLEYISLASDPQLEVLAD